MDTMEINSDVRERILAAAHELHEHSGRQGFPTFDAVRKRSRTAMADASAVMQECRRMHTAQPSTAAPAVPDRVQRADEAAIAALWADARGLAAESLQAAESAWATERAESDAERRELSAAFDAQGTELESLRAETQLTELRAAAAAAREEAGHLRGQAGTLSQQNAELLQALKFRDARG
jgi:hypothetical protein